MSLLAPRFFFSLRFCAVSDLFTFLLLPPLLFFSQVVQPSRPAGRGGAGQAPREEQPQRKPHPHVGALLPGERGDADTCVLKLTFPSLRSENHSVWLCRTKRIEIVTAKKKKRSGHSTESEALKVHKDIFAAMNNKRSAVLVFLDLTAAFDTVDPGPIL